jgi:hypothetical protein
MYEFDTVDELKQPFYLDQYDELAAVSNGNYPDHPIWHNLQPAERFLIKADAPELGDVLDTYADALAEYNARRDTDYDWPQQYQNALEQRLPSQGKNGIDTGYDDHFSVDLVVNGNREYMMFDEYVAAIKDELAAADDPDELQTLVETEHSDWYSDFGHVFDNWYDCVWDAMHVGTPPIIDIVTAEPGNAHTLHSTTAAAQETLEAEMKAFFDVADIA